MDAGQLTGRYDMVSGEVCVGVGGGGGGGRAPYGRRGEGSMTDADRGSGTTWVLWGHPPTRTGNLEMTSYNGWGDCCVC